MHDNKRSQLLSLLGKFLKKSEKPVITFASLYLCLVKGRIDKRFAEKIDCCWPRSHKFWYGVIKIGTVDRWKSMSGNPIHVRCQAIKLKLPDYLACTENSNNVDVAWHSNSLFCVVKPWIRTIKLMCWRNECLIVLVASSQSRVRYFNIT